VAALAFLGGVLGISAMIPLRRLLIVRSADELPYPEGTACAQVLRATAASAGGGGWIFLGLAVGAGVKLALGAAMLMPSELSAHVPVLPKAELALEIAPALLGVGYTLGYRQSAIMVSGSLISALVITPLIALVGDGLPQPLFPETTRTIHDLSAGQIWSRYVRHGAGAVAAGITVVRAYPPCTRPARGAGRTAGRRPRRCRARAPTAISRLDRPRRARQVVLALFRSAFLAEDMGPLPRLVAAPGRRDLRPRLRRRLAHRRPHRRLSNPPPA
jgi:uncharacterized oligopeptide transporter (OPT) family protein